MAKRNDSKAADITDLGELNMVVVAEDGQMIGVPKSLMKIKSSVPELSFWQARNKRVPEYATNFSAGFDFRADLEFADTLAFYDYQNKDREKTVRAVEGKNRVYIEAGERVLVPTGLYADIPQGFYIAIHSRSGTSWKQGLILTNGVGVVDADYVDEIKISLTNISGSRVYLEDGDRIAQGLVMPATKCPIHRLESQPQQKTNRAGGFGSTGNK